MVNYSGLVQCTERIKIKKVNGYYLNEIYKATVNITKSPLSNS